MVTVPKSPPAYARSSDMYSHMGTMPRPSMKRTRDQKIVQKAQEVGPEPHLVPQGLPDPPGLEAAKEVVGAADAPLEDTSTEGPNLSAVETDPMRKPEAPTADIQEERAPGDVHPEG